MHQGKVGILCLAPVEGLGVTVIREAARFADPKTIVSETTSTRARRIIIATGSTAFIPPIEGLDRAPYLTNETIFTLPEFPEHLVILGGGLHARVGPRGGALAVV